MRSGILRTALRQHRLYSGQDGHPGYNKEGYILYYLD